MSWRGLPKVELHLHLDCSLSAEVVGRLAPGVDRGRYEREYVAPAVCADLGEFLERAPKGFLLMQTEEALGLVVEDLFEQLAEDGVVYAEIRFAPLLHTQQGLTARRVVEVVEGACERQSRRTGIESGLLLCALRHFNEAQSLETAHLAGAFAGSRVVGLDLAGDEAGYPLAAHRGAFEYAERQGVARTAHAGEACGPSSVWETLRGLRPARIGHGVRSIEDEALVERLRAAGVHLEVCPSANVQIIPSLRRIEEHPIDRLLRAGVRLGVNCDTRMLTPTTLRREYELLAGTFGWGRVEFARVNEMAAEASFASEERRAGVLKKIRDGWA